MTIEEYSGGRDCSLKTKRKDGRSEEREKQPGQNRLGCFLIDSIFRPGVR